MYFHLSPVANRESILANGLDWRFMGAALGRAGSIQPELEGVYVVTSMEEVASMVLLLGSNHPDSLDLWAFELPGATLREGPFGFDYLPRTVPASALTRLDPPPPPVLAQSRDSEQTQIYWYDWVTNEPSLDA